jgi:tetratricopeptide (TPR) repeat protein
MKRIRQDIMAHLKNTGGTLQDFRQYDNPEEFFDQIPRERIYTSISDNLQILPDLYEYKTTLLRSQFRKDLLSFARQLMLADPQDFLAAANLISEHKVELEYLAELIQWRMKLRKQKTSQSNVDNPFYWRFTLQGAGVPPFVEEDVVGYHDRGEYDRSKVLFRLLTECFDGYAEGYNYLGLIALHEDELEEARGYFQTTVELGRKAFPKRIPRSRYWQDLSTRPYMRGLMNLALTLNRAGRYEEALEICDRLETECGDRPAAYRAAIYLNTGRWQEAADTARTLRRMSPSEEFVAAFALLELGRKEQALASFLYGTLQFPWAAHVLAGLRIKSPGNHGEAEDLSTGIEIRKDLAVYLGGAGRRSRRFFRRVIEEPEVRALLGEMEAVKERQYEQRSSTQREAYDRMRFMQSPEFAE